MKKVTLTVTNSDGQEHSTIPPESETRKYFQTSHYVRPASDGEGGTVGRMDLDGPIYPSWSTIRDANRRPSAVRIATVSELQHYNEIKTRSGEDHARSWLNEKWK